MVNSTAEENIPPPGIGIDIVDLDRFKSAYGREGFREKVFTKAEIDYCESKRDPIPSYGARFAVKEAFYKAIADPTLKSAPWKQIETVMRDNIPDLQLSDKLLSRIPGRRVFLSLTHSKKAAVAVVLIIPTVNTRFTGDKKQGTAE